MAYNYPEIKNFLGLFSQQNSFTLPDGAMEIAENIVLGRDGICQKRRGFYEYYEPGSGTLNNLALYDSTLIAFFNSKVSYLTESGTAPNKTGSASDLSGATVLLSSNRVARSVQSNKNLYFTTDNGVLKLEAYNSSIYKAGTAPALDLRATFQAGTNGPVDADCQLAWRVCYGRRDANDNLILGAPSDIVSLVNANITSCTYSSAGAGPYTVTVTDSAGHGLTTGTYVTVSSATDTDANGSYAITVTAPTTFTYQTTANPASGTLSYVPHYYTRLETTIPSDISTVNDGYFIQIYRTSQSLTSDVTPDSDFKLIEERKLTSAEISSRIFVFDDDIDDLLLGAELYTNPNSREGELQANARPPLCDDITVYKNHAIYGKCTSRHILDFSVIDTTGLADGDYVEVKVDSTTRRYVARTGVGNENVTGTVANDGSGNIQVTYTSHNLQNGDSIYIMNVTGGSLTEGTYYVINRAANTFEISTSSGGANVAYNSETALEFQGVTNGTYPIFYLNASGGSASLRLRETAQGLVKAINRDSSSLVYARYVSGLTEIPGKMRLEAKSFTGTIYMRGNDATTADAFSPVLATDFSTGDQVYSRNDDLPNFFFSSKIGEPEAVPLTNSFPVGARNKDILRVVALRDSLIVLKEDGVFRVNGDSPSNFSVTVLDNTVVCLDPSSVVVLNNQVIALSNQGVCLITDSSVQIISRRIEDPIQAILGSSNLVGQTAAIAYESDRHYLLSTLEPNGTTNGIVYVYNVLNDGWVTWDQTFKQGIVGNSDTLFLISTDNRILKERKFQTRLDFCGQNHATTVVSVASDALTAVITCSTRAPTNGDIIVQSDVINRVESSSLVSGNNYTVTFYRACNLVAANTPTLYEQYDSTIKLAPFHAGLVGRSKQFAQMQGHTKDESVTSVDISFSGNSYGESEVVTWSATEVGAAGTGWGNQPWGYFPWGNSDGVNITYGTKNAPIIRIYIPLFQQRNTYIQPRILHPHAGEAINLQSLSFAVRAYGERVSR
jgi:hypothetical protein